MLWFEPVEIGFPQFLSRLLSNSISNTKLAAVPEMTVPNTPPLHSSSSHASLNLADDDAFVSFFAEADQIHSVIANVLDDLDSFLEALSKRNHDDATEQWSLNSHSLSKLQKINHILGKYQEQPYLLDPHLEQLVQPVVTKIRNIISIVQEQSESEFESTRNHHVVKQISPLHPLFRYIHHLTNIRGYKTVVKCFTHQVSDLEPILSITESISTNTDPELWETRYILLLWLSLLSIIPFDLKTVDSATTGSATLVSRIISLSKHYIRAVGKEHEGAAILVTRLLTRTDTSLKHLPEFIRWAVSELESTRDVFRLRGILLTLCAIYKVGPRELLLPTVDTALQCCRLIDDAAVKTNALLRKLVIKLTQRVGLVCMKPRVAKWRYMRGYRSLEQNLNASKMGQQKTSISTDELSDDDDDITDIPESMDTIVETLLNGLRDRDTIVRWSSAKGIGRITNRLPKDLGQDIIDAVVSLLQEDIIEIKPLENSPPTVDISQVSDSTWHGTILSLAELSRRGLLLPHKLHTVIPWILRALRFDIRKGTHSIGSHVRDAACYVCWSFARAYSEDVLRGFAEQLGRELVVVSCCDREVNVRRAASAAFQEHVGRHVSLKGFSFVRI